MVADVYKAAKGGSCHCTVLLIYKFRPACVATFYRGLV